MKYPAPIYADSLRFVEWLLGHFDERPTHSARSLCDGALQFVASIAAALREDWPRDRLEEADYRL
ncbi:MAG: hypothetical protein GY944_06165, partial [bacterium]|nr:hypothetical protein [bacterium]